VRLIRAIFVVVAIGAPAACADAPGPAVSEAQPAFDRLEAEVILRRALADFDAAMAARQRDPMEAKARLEQARIGFQTVIDMGIHNAGLYYNLANTQLRLGEIGRAIVNYRRALRLDPSDPMIQHNLKTARDRVALQIEPPASSAFWRTLLFWHAGTSVFGRTIVALGAYALFWMLLGVRLFVFRRGTAMNWMLVLIGAVTLAAGGSVTWDTYAVANRAEGALIRDHVVLRKGNAESYERQIEQTLPEGVVFRLLETRRDAAGALWYRVELRDGRQGWIPAEAAEIV